MLMVWGVLSVFMAQECAAQPLLQMLDRIETSHANNILRLQTWQGVASIEFYLELQGFRQNQRASVRFAADVRHNRYSYRGHYEKVGRQLGDSIPISQEPETEYGGLIVEDDVFAISPTPGNKLKQKLIIRDFATNLNIGILSEDFYPMRFFRLGDREISDVFVSIRKNKKTDWLNVTAVRDGNEIRLRRSNTLLPNAFTEYVFDLSQGCNLVEFVNVDADAKRHCRYLFEEINGVWVPKTIQYDARVFSTNERRIKTIAFDTTGVNEAIPESNFTIEFIGALPGDVIADARTQQSYTLQGNTSRENQNRAVPSSEPEIPYWKFAILAVGLIIVVSVICWLIGFSLTKQAKTSQR